MVVAVWRRATVRAPWGRSRDVITHGSRQRVRDHQKGVEFETGCLNSCSEEVLRQVKITAADT